MNECYMLLKWDRIVMIREATLIKLWKRLLELLRLILSWGHLSFQGVIV